jgi:hypothetical protein
MKLIGSFVGVLGFIYTFALVANEDQSRVPARLYNTKFSNVLLIINFNHPYYGNIDFLKRLYSPFFPNIVFYGESADPRVTAIPTHIGFFISDVMSDVINKHPGYKGYLFLEDDCILNIWNCWDFDLDKIWLVRITSTCNMVTKQNAHSWAWSYPHGFEPTKKAFAHLSPKDLEILGHNVGKDNACGASADIFYFPARLKDDVLRLVPHFRPVFIEIAMPTILAALDYKENWQIINILWGPDNGSLHNRWPIEYTCIHPLKLSSVANQALIKRVFEKMIPGLTV